MFGQFRNLTKFKLITDKVIWLTYLSMIIFGGFIIYLIVLKNLDFSKLLDLERIFSLNPGSFSFLKEFLVFFGIIFLLGIISTFYGLIEKNRVKRKYIKKAGKIFYYISVSGFLYLFFRYQEASFLSGRYFLIIIILAFIFLSFLLFFLMHKKMPGELKKDEKKKILEKYIPKRKNK